MKVLLNICTISPRSVSPTVILLTLTQLRTSKALLECTKVERKQEIDEAFF